MGILPPLCQICPLGGGFVTRIWKNSHPVNAVGAAICRPSWFAGSPGKYRRGGYQPPGEMWAAGRRPRGILLPQGGLSSGMHPPLSSSQWPRPPSLAPAGQFTLSPLSSVSLAVTSSASLVPAMLARPRSLRCSGSPHHAGVAGTPMRNLRPLPCTPRALPRPLRGLGRSSSPHRAGRGGGPA